MPNRQFANINFEGTRTGRMRFLDTESIAASDRIVAETDFATIERRLMKMLTENGGQIDMEALKGIRVTPAMLEEAAKPETFTFDALSNKAKQRVRDWYVDTYGINTDSIQDELSKVLSELGYPTESIRYDSGNHKVAFYGYIKDWQLTKIARRLLTPRKAWYIRKLMVYGANIEIYAGSRYYGAKAQPENMEFSRDFRTYKAKTDLRRTSELASELRDAMESEAKFICNMLKYRGEQMMVELKTPEKLDAKIRELDNKYYEDGERVSRRRHRHEGYAPYSSYVLGA